MKPNDGSKMIKWGPKIETGNDPLPQMVTTQHPYRKLLVNKA